MSSVSDRIIKQCAKINCSRSSSNGDVFEPIVTPRREAKQIAEVIEWINSILPDVNFPTKASSEELRTRLIDGTVLLQILSRLRPISVNEAGGSDHSRVSSEENVKKFLASMDELGIPRFQASDLEKGSMKPVLDCLLTLKAQVVPGEDNFPPRKVLSKCGSPRGDTSFYGLESPTFSQSKHKVSPDSKFLQVLRSSGKFESSAALMHNAGHKFHEVFQLKHGRYADLSAAKISEMMKSNSLDNAPTQSLLSVVNGILDESIERKSDEIPLRVACLLRKVVQEIERRISTQAEHLRTQNNLFKSREEKYQSRITVLEALASGAGEERIAKDQPQQVKILKPKIEETKRLQEDDAVRLSKDKEERDLIVSGLRQELEIAKQKNELHCLQMETEAKSAKAAFEAKDLELVTLRKELETARKSYEQMETEAKSARTALDERHRDFSSLQRDLETMKNSYKQLRLQMESETKAPVAAGVAEKDLALSSLKQELEMAKERLEQQRLQFEAESKFAKEGLAERDLKLSSLRQELEIAKKNYEQQCLQMETESKDAKEGLAERDLKLSSLRQELELTKKKYGQQCLQMETESRDAKEGLEGRLKEREHQLEESREKVKALEHLLEDSREKVKVLEAQSKRDSQMWSRKMHVFQDVVKLQFGALQELRSSSMSIKEDISEVRMSYSEDFNRLGIQFRSLIDATKNYRVILTENRKLFNELQDLKGNIRVYCRIRPFLRGQTGRNTVIDYIGEDGELAVMNPAKQGKEGRRLFRFNKVYGPDSTQGEVFSDTQPLIRCILDGYNVCIFAYGQTGSGKTYTMTGPNDASEEEWGVNYRALNDLFRISQERRSTFMYEVGVQMVEIYNEQVRDLLSSGGSQKKLGIMSTSQPSGLAVPDATMQPVTSTADVLELMNIGLNNRAVSATAMNERSSRSHSVVSVHVRGKDLQTGASMVGNLHLVDLAGSERVDRSEVTGDRLREAQHINKSLSALGDVIFALAQKSSHVPYRNSKLTQLLQSSLGGHAKTLMFVQLNPDANAYSETTSTLKFAERVSGVELGAARSSKEGRDVKELMEQVASLKDTIAKKDDEIERLQVLKDLKNTNPSSNGDKNVSGSSRYSSSSNDSIGSEPDSSAGGTKNKLEKNRIASKVPRLQRPEKTSPATTTASRDRLKGSTNTKKTTTSRTSRSTTPRPPRPSQ